MEDQIDEENKFENEEFKKDIEQSNEEKEQSDEKENNQQSNESNEQPNDINEPNEEKDNIEENNENKEQPQDVNEQNDEKENIQEKNEENDEIKESEEKTEENQNIQEQNEEKEEVKDVEEQNEVKEINEEKNEEINEHIEENKEEKHEELNHENEEQIQEQNEIKENQENNFEKNEQVIPQEIPEKNYDNIEEEQLDANPNIKEEIKIPEKKHENIQKNNIPEEDDKLKINKIYISKTSELNGKTLYHIKGDFIPKDKEVIRRYRDFDLLHVKLNQNWPCIFVPPIPPKKYFSSSTDKAVVDERIYQLENFLKMTSDFPYILNTPEMQLFLNKDINNSDKFQVEMKKLAPYNYKQISENYTKIFSEYKSQKKEDLNFDKLDTYIEYISGFVAKLNEYKKQLVIFGDIPKNNIYRESKVVSHFIEFEKNAMINFVDKNDTNLLYFHNEKNGLGSEKEKYEKLTNNPYLILSGWIRLKELELISIKDKLIEYRDLVNKRNSYETKLNEMKQKLNDINVGKINFFQKIFVKGDVNKLKEKQETELKNHTSETQYINNIVNILNDYISVEYNKYFAYLTKNFYHIVRNFATSQKENSILAMELWLKVKNNTEEDTEKINEILKEKK